MVGVFFSFLNKLGLYSVSSCDLFLSLKYIFHFPCNFLLIQTNFLTRAEEKRMNYQCNLCSFAVEMFEVMAS